MPKFYITCPSFSAELQNSMSIGHLTRHLYWTSLLAAQTQHIKLLFCTLTIPYSPKHFDICWRTSLRGYDLQSTHQLEDLDNQSPPPPPSSVIEMYTVSTISTVGVLPGTQP